MIASKDRAGWFGASDTAMITGSWVSDSFTRWWLQKLGINRDSFENQFTLAGTHYEHRILESLGIPMELDRQVVIDDLLLRVNLDGDDGSTIYECKTFRYAKGYTLPQKHMSQVQVQMFATGIRRAEIVAYGLVSEDYGNYFRPIDQSRLERISLPYNEPWVTDVYLPRLRFLADCLRTGRFPRAKDFRSVDI